MGFYEYPDHSFTHYGVKGMRWGVRKQPEQKVAYSTDRTVRKAQKKYDRNLKRNWHKAYNKAADYANKVLIPEINKKYSSADLKNEATYKKYVNEYYKKFDKVYQQEVKNMFGERPK